VVGSIDNVKQSGSLIMSFELSAAVPKYSSAHTLDYCDGSAPFVTHPTKSQCFAFLSLSLFSGLATVCTFVFALIGLCNVEIRKSEFHLLSSSVPGPRANPSHVGPSSSSHPNICIRRLQLSVYFEIQCTGARPNAFRACHN